MGKTTDNRIDLGDLIASLDFSDEQTADAAQNQPALFLEAARYRVQKLRKKHKREAALKVLRSDKARKYRTELRELGQRVTDKEIEEKLSRNTLIRDALSLVDRAEEEEEFAKLLVEAYRMRSTSIKVVSELIGAEIYVARRMEGTDTQLSEIKKRLKEKYPGRVLKEERRDNKR